jgi:lysophospholipase L1-like esterase
VRHGWLALAAFLALTCHRPGRPELAHARSAAWPKVARPTPPAKPPLLAKPGPLGPFFDALRKLAAGRARDHVRVLWLGDSHTAADFLSGTLRSALAERFGDGGPGFVRIGLGQYRHDGLKIVSDGPWNVDPDPPARRSLQDDGVFGLGGTRAEPGAGASFSLALSGAAASCSDAARFELAYTLPVGSSFDVTLGEQRTTVREGTSTDLALSKISHLALSGPINSHLVIVPRSGAPRLFGVSIERTAPLGVVLDTAGIDGARLETPLSWNEAAFEAEVQRRAPALFVIAYGTNEAFDALKVDKYAAHLSELVRRVRLGAALASCLVLGPPDAALGEASVPRVAEVGDVLREASAKLGCSFVSLQQLMGGEGSFARGMHAKERLAQIDRLHLTPKGYQELGRALAAKLLGAYSAGRADLP